MDDAIRVVTLIIGGCAVGAGFPILIARHKVWKESQPSVCSPPSFSLLAVNTLVFAYLTFDLLSYYGQPLTWRTPLALLIFIIKIVMLLHIRETTLNIRHQLAKEGLLERRTAPQRRESDTPEVKE